MWKRFNTIIATNTFSENAAHVLAGYAAVLTVVHFRGDLLVWSIAFVLCAALKEYIYDAEFETPHQSLTMNTTDFLGYCIGITIGALATL